MKEIIQKAVEVLEGGGIILYPTDTVWGIGCDASNTEAINRIFKLKQREESKSMVVLVANEVQLERSVEEVPEMAWDLIELSEKPTTLVLNNPIGFSKKIVAQDNSIGIRVTRDRFCQELIRRFRKPIVSTSANISGKSTPGNFDAIETTIKDGVDYIVPLRQEETEPKTPSSIIKIDPSGLIQILRK